MTARSEAGDVVLRLFDGRGLERIVLEAGRAAPPLTLGRAGGWRIEGARVADAHVMLAFNGASLFASACPGENATLGGAPLEARWTEVHMPIELRFGAARVGIGRRARPDAETEVLGDAHDEATRIDEGDVAFPVASRAGDEEATCYDEERLREALRLAIPDGESTCVADVEIPPAARRPEPPPLPSMAAVPAAFERRAPTLVMPPTSRAPELAPRAVAVVTPYPPVVAMPAVAPPAGTATAVMSSVSMPSVSMPSVSMSPMPSTAARLAAMPASTRTLASPILSLADDRPSCMPSCMPPTMPSDGLAEAGMLPLPYAPPAAGAAAYPPSSTHATPAASHSADPREPLPSLDAFDPRRLPTSAAFAPVGEQTAVRRADRRAPGAAASFFEHTLLQLRQVSGPKKAIGVLLFPLLALSALAARGAPPAPVVHAPPAPVMHAPIALTSATVAPPSTPIMPFVPSPNAGVAASVAPSRAAPNATPTPMTAPSAAPDRARRPAAGDGLHDTRTAERHALDTAATGDALGAAAEYDALAVAHPDNLAFPEAARIMRARGARRVD